MNIFELIIDFILISLAGLFIAFSPMLIITDLLIVLKSKRPILHAIVLLASIATPLLLLAFIATNTYLKPGSSISLDAISDKLTIPPLISLAGGIILIVVGVRQFIKIKYLPLQQAQNVKPSKKPPTKIIPLFIFGFMKTLFSLTNIFAILFVTKLVVSSKLSPLLALMVVLWTIIVGLVPFFVILYYQKNKREYLLRLQATIDARMSKNLKAYAYGGLAILGSMLSFTALLQLIDKF